MNTGDPDTSGTSLKALAVELRPSPSPSARSSDAIELPAFPRERAVNVFENSKVIVWDVTFSPDVPLPFHRHEKAGILMPLTDGQLNISSRTNAQPQLQTTAPGDTIAVPLGHVDSEQAVAEAVQCDPDQIQVMRAIRPFVIAILVVAGLNLASAQTPTQLSVGPDYDEFNLFKLLWIPGDPPSERHFDHPILVVYMTTVIVRLDRDGVKKEVARAVGDIDYLPDGNFSSWVVPSTGLLWLRSLS